MSDRYMIDIDVGDGEIHVSVSKNGAFYDEASFSITEDWAEFNEFIDYLRDLADEIAIELRRKLWGD